MTIFVSVETDTGVVRRYDSAVPHGLTHAGRLTHLGEGAATSIAAFRQAPAAALRFDPDVGGYGEAQPCVA